MSDFNTDLQEYYVYIHMDPDTRETVYVGMGRKWRAWATGTARPDQRSYGRRHPWHNEWHEGLYEKGYFPPDWVRILHRGLTKEAASEKEIELIKELKPRFNKLHNDEYTGLKRFPQDLVSKVKDLRNNGMVYEKIAKELKLSSGMAAWRMVNEY